MRKDKELASCENTDLWRLCDLHFSILRVGSSVILLTYTNTAMHQAAATAYVLEAPSFCFQDTRTRRK